MKKKIIIKVQTSVTVGGRSYKTAKNACDAWANSVFYRMYDRHTEKIGHSAYHDKAWSERNIHDNNCRTVGSGAVVYYAEPEKAIRKAYRRSIKIFEKIFSQQRKP